VAEAQIPAIAEQAKGSKVLGLVKRRSESLTLSLPILGGIEDDSSESDGTEGKHTKSCTLPRPRDSRRHAQQKVKAMQFEREREQENIKKDSFLAFPFQCPFRYCLFTVGRTDSSLQPPSFTLRLL
jgi:hypothetical protein